LPCHLLRSLKTKQNCWLSACLDGATAIEPGLGIEGGISEQLAPGIDLLGFTFGFQLVKKVIAPGSWD
jgi:hypothetical protein